MTARSSGFDTGSRTSARSRFRLPGTSTWPTRSLRIPAIYLPARAVAGVPGQSGRFDAAPGSLGWPVHEGTDMGPFQASTAASRNGCTRGARRGVVRRDASGLRRRPRALIRSRGLRDGVAVGCLRRVAGPLRAADRAEHGPAWWSRAGACRRHGGSARAGTRRSRRPRSRRSWKTSPPPARRTCRPGACPHPRSCGPGGDDVALKEAERRPLVGSAATRLAGTCVAPGPDAA